MVLDDYDGQMTPGNECGLISYNICLTVEGKHLKNSQPEITPTGDRTQARWMRSNDVTPPPQRWSCLDMIA